MPRKQKPDPRTRLAAAMDRALRRRGITWADMRSIDLEWDKQPRKDARETVGAHESKPFERINARREGDK